MRIWLLLYIELNRMIQMARPGRLSLSKELHILLSYHLRTTPEVVRLGSCQTLSLFLRVLSPVCCGVGLPKHHLLTAVVFYSYQILEVIKELSPLFEHNGSCAHSIFQLYVHPFFIIIKLAKIIFFIFLVQKPR